MKRQNVMLKARPLRILRASYRLYRTSRKVTLGLTILFVLAGISVLEPFISNYMLKGNSPTSLGLFGRLLPFSIEHPLGTDHYGRDILGLLFNGLKHSLAVGFLAGSIATLLAVVIALMAAYKGGKWDTVLNSFTSAVLVLPSWAIAAAMVAYTERLNIYTLSFVIAAFIWAWSARTIRAQALSLRERPYIDLARLSGSRDYEIIFKEMLPNLLPYIAVGFSYAVVGAILFETGLRLIGLAPGEFMTLGLLIHWNLTIGVISQGYYYMLLSPIFFLVLIFASLNLINVGLDEVFNPRLKKITGA